MEERSILTGTLDSNMTELICNVCNDCEIALEIYHNNNLLRVILFYPMNEMVEQERITRRIPNSHIGIFVFLISLLRP
jgi:hypothetical protein